jgi:bacterioferritin-associated ferredoxin
MYVCICHAVTDRQIIAAAERGITRLADLRKELGVPGNCGRCALCARELVLNVIENRGTQAAPLPAFN